MYRFQVTHAPSLHSDDCYYQGKFLRRCDLRVGAGGRTGRTYQATDFVLGSVLRINGLDFNLCKCTNVFTERRYRQIHGMAGSAGGAENRNGNIGAAGEEEGGAFVGYLSQATKNASSTNSGSSGPRALPVDTYTMKRRGMEHQDPTTGERHEHFGKATSESSAFAEARLGNTMCVVCRVCAFCVCAFCVCVACGRCTRGA